MENPSEGGSYIIDPTGARILVERTGMVAQKEEIAQDTTVIAEPEIAEGDK